MKKFKQFVLNNYLKLVAVVISFFLWSNAKSYFDPDETDSFPVNITILGEESLTENKYILTNKNELLNKTILVKVKAPRLKMEELRIKKNLIKATINLNAIINSSLNKIGTPIQAYIDISLPVLDESYIFSKPEVAQIILDERISVTKKIEVAKVNNAAEPYYAIDPEVSPKEIKITGAKSLINSIKPIIKVNIDIDGKTSDITEYCKVQVLTNEDEDITDQVELSDSEVFVKVPVYKSGIVKIMPTYFGNPAEGYKMTDIKCDPDSIKVLGLEDAIESTKRIALREISIENAKADIVDSYDLINDLSQRGLRPRYDSNTVVTVVYKIEPILTETVIMPASQISIRGSSYPLEISSEEVELKAYGVESKLKLLKKENILISVDVSEFEPGTYEVQPIVAVAIEDIEIVTSKITVVIYPIQDVNTTEPSETINEITE